MEILSDERNQDVARWLPHGMGFVIESKKRFAAEILPRYFARQAKFTSFTRKLNRWCVNCKLYCTVCMRIHSEQIKEYFASFDPLSLITVPTFPPVYFCV